MIDYSVYEKNITEFPAREIEQVHIPNDIASLKKIVQIANCDRRAIYPISTGHNWGLGSKLPVVDAEIIDLSQINRIIEVNKELAYARIQPGVTQQQLHEYLEEHAPELMLNVTGSDSGSSILANVLERGSGKNGHRADDLRELKVMLANGDIISTGFGAQTHSSFYKYGLGMDLTHLFTQSNLGVITEGVINLRLKQPFTLYLARLEESSLGLFLERFARLVRTEVIGHSLELDSQNDPKIHELFDGSEQEKSSKEWLGWFVIYGEDEIRTAKENAVERELSSCLTKIKKYNSCDDFDNYPMPIQVRMDRYSGKPNDHSLTASAQAFGVDISQEDGKLDIDKYVEMPGFRCVLPVVPFSAAASEVIDLIYDFSKSKKFSPAISIIGLNAYSLEVFVRVYFNRNSKQEIRKAGLWAEGLLDLLKHHGILPYRLDVENMVPYLERLEDSSTKLKTKLKSVFDPNGIIAPKRYTL